jgi:nitrate/nitrite transporter NarK
VIGLVGGLGGFILPLASDALNDLTGVWQSCFWLLFAIVTTALVWMHISIRHMECSAVEAGGGPGQTGREGNSRHHRLHLGRGGLWRLLHPEGLRQSIVMTGGAEPALYGFLGFYTVCIGVIRWFYTRRGGLLFDTERQGKAERPMLPVGAD